MANTILIGMQWGDEGKGKIIDVLTAQRRHCCPQSVVATMRAHCDPSRDQVHFALDPVWI